MEMMRLYAFEKKTNEQGEFYACLELLRIGKRNLLMFFFNRENPEDRSYFIYGGGLNLWLRLFSESNLFHIEMKLGHLKFSFGIIQDNFVGS